MHSPYKGNIFFVRVLHDGNTNRGSFHKPNSLIDMFSTMLKGSKPFTIVFIRSLVKVFCFSSIFLYVVILLKNAKMDLGVTIFQTLELCFSEAFVSIKHHCCIISLTYVFKMLYCSISQKNSWFKFHF